MGTCGAGLFQDDTACEVRDDYVKNLEEGLSDGLAGRRPPLTEWERKFGKGRR